MVTFIYIDAYDVKQMFEGQLSQITSCLDKHMGACLTNDLFDIATHLCSHTFEYIDCVDLPFPQSIVEIITQTFDYDDTTEYVFDYLSETDYFDVTQPDTLWKFHELSESTVKITHHLLSDVVRQLLQNQNVAIHLNGCGEQSPHLNEILVESVDSRPTDLIVKIGIDYV